MIRFLLHGGLSHHPEPPDDNHILGLSSGLLICKPAGPSLLVHIKEALGLNWNCHGKSCPDSSLQLDSADTKAMSVLRAVAGDHLVFEVSHVAAGATADLQIFGPAVIHMDYFDLGTCLS